MQYLSPVTFNRAFLPHNFKKLLRFTSPHQLSNLSRPGRHNQHQWKAFLDKAVISNNAKVEYDIATTDWGQVSHWGIRTAQTGGNLLCKGSFSRVENVQTGNRFTIEIGNLQVSME